MHMGAFKQTALSGLPTAKTIAATMLGFALAAVGIHSGTGQLRMTDGFPGFDFLMVVLTMLGDMAEASVRQAMLLWQGNLGIFVSNLLVGCTTGLALLLLVLPLWGLMKRRIRQREYTHIAKDTA